MRVSNPLWTVGALLSGVSQSSQKAIPDAALAARQVDVPPPQTITIPGTVSTVSGGTVTQTVTEAVPGTTTTVTQDGYLVISTIPAQSIVQTKVLTVSPYPVPLPGSTTVVTPISQVTLCPEPVGRVGTNLRTDKPLLFGCPAGFVCNPPMPDSCNMWPGVPSSDFVCRPEDCILAPPTTNEITWDSGKIKHYSPAWGYFHLDPRTFGLSYDIFGYETSGNAKRNTNDRKKLGKRQLSGAPEVCYGDCDLALRFGQEIGADPAICEDIQFNRTLGLCRECVVAWAVRQNITNPNPRDYLVDTFDPWLDNCDGTPPVITSSTTGPAGQGPPTTTGTVVTTSGVTPGTSSFEPITTSSTTSTSSPSSSSLPPTTTSSTTSTSSSISLNTSSSTTSSTSSSTTLSTSSSGTLSSFSSTSGGASPSDTSSTSSSASVETSSSGSPGSSSIDSPESASTGNPEFPSTSSPDAPSAGFPDVPSASPAETPGSSETSSSTALPSFSNSTVTTVTPSAPTFPITPTSTPSTTPIAPPPPSSAVVLLPAGATLLVLLFTTLALLI